MTSVLDGITVSERDSAAAAREDHTASTKRLAASLVHGFVTRHRCHGHLCRHRNHRRDAHHETLLDDVLDLPAEAATLADYDSPLEWASVSKGEAASLAHSAGGR